MQGVLPCAGQVAERVWTQGIHGSWRERGRASRRYGCVSEKDTCLVSDCPRRSAETGGSSRREIDADFVFDRSQRRHPQGAQWLSCSRRSGPRHANHNIARRKMKTLRLSFLLAISVFSVGCASVKPWQRG